MILAILVILILLNFLLGFYNKKKNTLLFINFVFILIFMSGYAEGVDIFAYKYNYELFAEGKEMMFDDIGYVVLSKLCVNLNLTFWGFKFLATFLALLLLFSGIKRLHVNPHFVLACYMSYQMMTDTIQYRNFLGWCILFFSFPFLFENTRKGNVKYIIGVIISALFHSALLANLLFILIGKKSIIRFMRNTIIFVGVVLSVLTLLNNYRVPFIDIVINMFSLDYVGGYTNEAASGPHGVSYLLSIITVIAEITFFGYQFRIYKPDEKAKNLFNIDKLSVLFLPLCIMSFQFYRLIRNIKLLSLCGVDWCYQKNLRSSNHRRIVLAFCIVFLGFWIYSDFFRFVTLNNMRTLFDNNIYWSVKYKELGQWIR